MSQGTEQEQADRKARISHLKNLERALKQRIDDSNKELAEVKAEIDSLTEGD